MPHHLIIALVAIAALSAQACAKAPAANAPLAHYKYPAKKVLGAQYAPNKHFAITVFDEGTGSAPQITAVPSDKNQLGDKQTVTDENLIFIGGRSYTYLAFYDDWTIQESVEVVFDEDGRPIKTVTVLYNKNGEAVSTTETPAL